MKTTAKSSKKAKMTVKPTRKLVRIAQKPVSNTIEATNKQELPFGESYWDKLPNELHDIIFNFCGKYYDFLNGLLGSADELDDETALAVWRDAFKYGWLGDYSLLPHVIGPNKKFQLENDELVYVKSRAVYKRLANFLPHMSESNPAYDTIDAEIHKSMNIHTNFIIPYGLHVYSIILCRCLINIAMRNMWLDILKDKIKTVPYAVEKECIFNGHVDLLRHFLGKSIVKIEHLKRYRYKSKYNDDDFCFIMDAAASHGHLDILKLFHESGGTGITINTMDKAAQKGHLDILKWLHENRLEGCNIYAMNWAAENGHFKTVKWLYESRKEKCTSNAIDYAAINGHNQILIYLFERKCKFTIFSVARCNPEDIAKMLVDSLARTDSIMMLRKLSKANITGF